MKRITLDRGIHRYVAFAMTSSPGPYYQERILLLEEFPEHGDWTVARADHCSCYEFEDARWEATTYTRPELVKLFNGWLEQGNDLEKEFATSAIFYVKEGMH